MCSIVETDLLGTHSLQLYKRVFYSFFVKNGVTTLTCFSVSRYLATLHLFLLPLDRKKKFPTIHYYIIKPFVKNFKTIIRHLKFRFISMLVPVVGWLLIRVSFEILVPLNLKGKCSKLIYSISIHLAATLKKP